MPLSNLVPALLEGSNYLYLPFKLILRSRPCPEASLVAKELEYHDLLGLLLGSELVGLCV